MTPPQYLYKYEPFSTQALLNLKKQIIYFGSPLNFNDPYDCALTPKVLNPTDTEIELIREKYLKDPDLPTKARIEFETSDVKRLRQILVRSAQDVFQLAADQFLKQRGVACFSERNDDLLMWSHYGGKYKGFCLEFNTASEAFQKVQKVSYVRNLPEHEISGALLDEEFDNVMNLFCTKSADWSYEKEWRAIHNEAGTEFGYLPEALTGIYFGPDIDIQSLEIICLILSGQNEKVKFWKGTRSN